ncbi:helix-turn-helix transcriptional regulator [Xanthomonas hyacinthi]|uniref:AraC family transcriptional regulator n=1 Tax=Xanthomonas hyacinthi TaxID=56455 RepID=A0A2S7EQP4_9XANT|nr:AraC family transcriptional regulator [Xanthomonas hyacinthi]KLD75352.1 hypothetical protein Y886_27515 [Xanthomonas hyacinthi DSM 19077]PPU95410.1 AraC family transcriptional regulator [Xanthomonas hyacinthi]QGY78808.1 helix-turn-helix transcriptional regulator [Xanthomonas hyacinthi]
MNYRLTADDISPPRPLDRSPWWRSTLTEDVGNCFIDQLKFDDGLTLSYAQYDSRHDLLETRASDRSGRALTITLALEGCASTIGADGRRFDFISGYSTIAAFAGTQGKRRVPADQVVRQLRLIAEEPLLHRYGLEGVLDGVNNEQSVQSLFFGKFGGLTQRLTDSFDHLRRHDGSLLDLQIVALGLLSEQTRPFAKQRAVMDKVRASDQDKMLAARDIMMSQYDHPLTIAYLCTRVGTNEFKLKQGFRELFGTSPHRMLTDIRMQKAWELLETGLYVSTVAYKVGYQHLSSFSAAFERYYGRTPKSVTKSTS